MMRYIIILKVRKFHQTTANRFSTARIVPPPSLNRVKFKLVFLWCTCQVSLPCELEQDDPRKLNNNKLPLTQDFDILNFVVL